MQDMSEEILCTPKCFIQVISMAAEGEPIKSGGKLEARLDLSC